MTHLSSRLRSLLPPRLFFEKKSHPLRKPFQNYAEIKPKIPLGVWYALRTLTLASLLGLIFALFRGKDWALLMFWGVLVSLLPLLFFMLPGLWRNICPLAALNQMPRALRLSLEWKLPSFLSQWAFAFASTMLIACVSLRPILFDDNATALAALLTCLSGLAILGGVLFKGKGGWCGTICPLSPLQRLYGQSPLVPIRNAYCRPCIGCQKNCYDFNPKPALLQDLDEPNQRYVWQRHVFVGLLPGLIFAYFSEGASAQSDIGAYYRSLLVALCLSSGAYFMLLSYVPLSSYRIFLCFIAVSLGLFYWSTLPLLFSSMRALGEVHFTAGGVSVFSPTLEWLALGLAWGGAWGERIAEEIRYGLLALLLAGMGVSLIREQRFLSLKTTGGNIAIGNVAEMRRGFGQKEEPTFLLEETSKKHCLVEHDRSVLEAMEHEHVPIESGCRMGICGADPIVVLEGEENLKPMGEEEHNTLLRLGLLGKARLACMMRLKGPIVVSLNLAHRQARALPEQPALRGTLAGVSSFSLGSIDKRLRIPQKRNEDKNKDMRIVVVGNGIAGTSAVQYARMLSPYCSIAQISSESYSFYNRMGLCRLIHGRSDMAALHLLPKTWFKKNKVDLWLSTQVDSIRPEQRSVQLSTGDRLPYDRLLLATGSSAITPPHSGLSGVFTMHGAHEAIHVRNWIQQQKAAHAVSVGGGLQGVEIALALREMGVKVTLVHRHNYLIDRQGDKVSAAILQRHLEQHGVEVLLGEEVLQLLPQSSGAKEHVEAARLKNKGTIATDMCVFSIGVRPESTLGRSAGLAMRGEGIAVNEFMQTSDPHISAAGDCARWKPSAISGLWGIGLEMGRVAAHNMLGFPAKLQTDIFATPYILKAKGFDLHVFGRTTEIPGDRSFQRDSVAELKWWRIVVDSENRIVGGAFVNHSEMAVEVRRAIRQKLDASMLAQRVEGHRVQGHRVQGHRAHGTN